MTKRQSWAAIAGELEGTTRIGELEHEIEQLKAAIQAHKDEGEALGEFWDHDLKLWSVLEWI